MTESSPPDLPKFEVRSLILYFWENWAAIRQHWLLLVRSMGISAVVGGYAVRQFDAKQIDILQADNTLLKDHNSTLQSIATITPPSQWRRLSDTERSQIIAAMKALPNLPDTILVFAVAETESRQYAAQFADLFRSIGIKVEPREVPGSFVGTAEIGLMVGISTYPNPSPEAARFKQSLTSAGLQVRHVQWRGEEFDGTKYDYDLYVGSKPW